MTISRTHSVPHRTEATVAPDWIGQDWIGQDMAARAVPASQRDWLRVEYARLVVRARQRAGVVGDLAATQEYVAALDGPARTYASAFVQSHRLGTQIWPTVPRGLSAADARQIRADIRAALDATP